MGAVLIGFASLSIAIGLVGTGVEWTRGNEIDVVPELPGAPRVTVPPAPLPGEATSTATTSTSAATTTTTPVETPEAFARRLGQAIAAGEMDFLVGRLHPVVLSRYGEEQCRATIAAQLDETSVIDPKEVRGPQEFTYTTDGLTDVVPDSFTVVARRVQRGQETEGAFHFARADGGLRWFTDCGDPV